MIFSSILYLSKKFGYTVKIANADLEELIVDKRNLKIFQLFNKY